MIISGVRAENVLKYAVLKLDSIPQTGLIAVIGDNESGKSSIGESICFALFGRTFSLGPDELDKVIRWGESRCSIRLDFSTPDGRRYQIARFLDELGNHGASISRSGEDPMVRGVDEVAASLKEIIGFGYTEFIESFYLAQREITTPHPHSFAVKAMAGVDALEKASASCAAEIEVARRHGRETSAQKSDVDAQIAALDVDARVLASLELERLDAQAAEEVDRRNIRTLKDRVEHHGANLSEMKPATADWLAILPEASLTEREVQCSRIQGLLSMLAPAYADSEHTSGSFAALTAAVREVQGAVEGFRELFRDAGSYRARLGRLLDHPDPSATEARSTPATGRSNVESVGDPGVCYSEERRGLEESEQAIGARRSRTRMLSVLLLCLGLFAWGAWGLLSSGADSGWTFISSFSARYPAMSSEILPWLPYGAGLLTITSLLVMSRSPGITERLRHLRAEMEHLAEEEDAARREYADLDALEERPLPQACQTLAKLRETDFSARVDALARGRGAVLLDPEAHTTRQQSFDDDLRGFRQGIITERAAAENEIERLHEAITRHATRVARLDGMIEQEEKRVRRHEELSEIARTLQVRLEELAHRVRVRELAMELLEGAIHYISQRFNTEIRNLAADSLPKFTNGRYEHLQIDENLKVKAFSNEKRNFMELDEISSGTQRQIMLAVRLALSQKLVNSVIQGAQMLFLDEPFAFFDEVRTAAALSVLPEVSRQFTQIWVTSQTFPSQAVFDLVIECDPGLSHSPKVWSAEPAGHG